MQWAESTNFLLRHFLGKTKMAQDLVNDIHGNRGFYTISSLTKTHTLCTNLVRIESKLVCRVDNISDFLWLNWQMECETFLCVW